MVDADPQGSLSDWWNERKADFSVFVQTSVPRLQDDVGRLLNLSIQLLVSYTPPAITATIALADLVVVPTRPRPHDLRSVGRTVDLVERYGKPLVFVINGAHPTARGKSPAASIVAHQATHVGANQVVAWRLQIVSLSSRKSGRRELTRLKTANPDLLCGLALTVSPNRSGSMFRMRVGPLAGRDAANKLCAGLNRRRTDCLILRPKP